jgi:hypothetical protein
MLGYGINDIGLVEVTGESTQEDIGEILIRGF